MARIRARLGAYFGSLKLATALILSLVPMATLFSQSSNAQTALSAETEVVSGVQASNRVKAGWNLFLSSDNFANDRESAQIAGFGLGGRLKYQFTSSLLFDGAVRMRMQSGFAQSVFGENTPKSGIELRQAVLRLRPFSAIEFSAGAIDQAELKAPILVSSRPFPALSQLFSVGSRSLKVELRTQQAIPTSTSMTTKAVEVERTPIFFAETLSLSSFPEGSFVRGRIFGTHFLYRDLPTAVARESDILGNSILENSPGFPRFAYEFEGWVAGGEFALNLGGGFVWKAEAQMIQNMKAPQSFRNGQLATTSLKMNLPGNMEFEPKAGTFFAESDVSPGLYNESDFGHNNRIGWLASAVTTFRDAGFTIAANFIDSKVLQASALQSDQKFFMIRFETLYDVL